MMMTTTLLLRVPVDVVGIEAVVVAVAAGSDDMARRQAMVLVLEVDLVMQLSLDYKLLTVRLLVVVLP